MVADHQGSQHQGRMNFRIAPFAIRRVPVWDQSAEPLIADIRPGIFPLPHAPEIGVIFNPNLPRALAALWARFGI